MNGMLRQIVLRKNLETKVLLMEPCFLAGHEWDIQAQRNHLKAGRPVDRIYLNCNEKLESSLWKCEGTVRFEVFDNQTNTALFPAKTFSIKFSNEDKKLKMWTDDGTTLTFNSTVVVTIDIELSTGVPEYHYNKFENPDENMTDVVLIVEEKKIHVSKQVLAMQSKHFHRMFYGKFDENGKQEIVLHELVYSEFLDLLNLVYPSSLRIDASSTSHLLRLADRFEMPTIIQKVEESLINCSTMPIIDKLLYAEQYQLAQLQAACLKEVNDSRKILRLANDKKFNQLSKEFMALIIRKLAKLVRNGDQPLGQRSPTYSTDSYDYSD